MGIEFRKGYMIRLTVQKDNKTRHTTYNKKHNKCPDIIETFIQHKTLSF